MNLNRFTTTATLIAALLGGSIAAPPAESATREYWASVTQYNKLVQEIHGHVNRLCAPYPPTRTCNRVQLESDTLFRQVRTMPIDQAIYRLANYAGQLRATK